MDAVWKCFDSPTNVWLLIIYYFEQKQRNEIGSAFNGFLIASSIKSHLYHMRFTLDPTALSCTWNDRMHQLLAQFEPRKDNLYRNFCSYHELVSEALFSFIIHLNGLSNHIESLSSCWLVHFHKFECSIACRCFFLLLAHFHSDFHNLCFIFFFYFVSK